MIDMVPPVVLTWREVGEATLVRGCHGLVMMVGIAAVTQRVSRIVIRAHRPPSYQPKTGEPSQGLVSAMFLVPVPSSSVTETVTFDVSVTVMTPENTADTNPCDGSPVFG
ncbi:MAG: hypothetical protein EBV88_07400 [Actinobacteria bacterium]|nr:hypothetical protein [Actinomycetota bacterium]